MIREHEWTVPDGAPVLPPDHVCTVLASRVKVADPGALEFAFAPYAPVIWEGLMTSVGCLGGSLHVNMDSGELWTMGAWQDSLYTDQFVQHRHHGVAMHLLRRFVVSADFASWQMPYRQMPPDWVNLHNHLVMRTHYDDDGNEFPDGEDLFGERPTQC